MHQVFVDFSVQGSFFCPIPISEHAFFFRPVAEVRSRGFSSLEELRTITCFWHPKGAALLSYPFEPLAQSSGRWKLVRDSPNLTYIYI